MVIHLTTQILTVIHNPAAITMDKHTKTLTQTLTHIQHHHNLQVILVILLQVADPHILKDPTA